MEIMINKKLRELRRKRGNTQEELASHLMISTQAVSKWERGGASPDIAYLPKIAAFYGVTVDELLGVSELERQERIDAAIKKWTELKAAGRYDECLEIWSVLEKEYPNDVCVLYHIMYSLHYIKGSDAHRIIQLGEMILSENREQGLREGAIHCLCMAYHRLGDDESAREYALMAGNDLLTRGALLVTVLKGRERQEHCKKMLNHHLDMIDYMLRHAGWADEQERRWLDGYRAKVRNVEESIGKILSI